MPKAQRTDSRLWRGEQPAQHCTSSEHRRTMHWLVDGAQPWSSCQVRIKSGDRKGQPCGADLVEVIRPMNIHLGRATSKTAAVKATSEAKVAAGHGTFVAPARGKTLMATLLDAWLADHKRRVRPNTYVVSEIVVRRHIVPRVGSMTLDQMTPSSVKAILDAMYDEVGKRTSTQRKVRNILHGVFVEAMRDQAITKNPLAGYQPPGKNEARSERITAWTPEVAAAFFEFPTVAADPFRAAFRTAALTGLRDSEVCGLRRRDVVLTGDREHDDHLDGSKPHLDVRQTRVRVGKEVMVGEPKTKNSRRTVPLAPSLERELRAYRAAQPVAQLDGFLFLDEHGEPMAPHVLSMRFARRVGEFIEANPEVPRIGMHGLRHTFATTLFKRRVDLLTVSRLLGHSSTSFTLDVYGHLLPDTAQEAIHDIEAAFGGQLK